MDKQHSEIAKGTAASDYKAAASDLWTTEQAIALLRTEDEGFAANAASLNATALALSLGRWKSDGHRHMRGLSDAKDILHAALITGRVTATGQVGGSPRRQVPPSFLKSSRFTEIEGRCILEKSKPTLVRWADLQFSAREVKLLAYENSGSKLKSDADAAWRDESQKTWLLLHSAVRLVVEMTNEDGPALAALLSGPIESWNTASGASPSQMTLASDAWDRAAATLLQSLQTGTVAAKSDRDIAKHEWARSKPNWWESSLGQHLAIVVARAEVLNAGTPEKSDTAPSSAGSNPESNGLLKKKAPSEPELRNWYVERRTQYPKVGTHPGVRVDIADAQAKWPGATHLKIRQMRANVCPDWNVSRGPRGFRK